MKRFISASLSVCLVLACSGFESLALIQDEDVPQETVELVTDGEEVDSDEASDETASDEEETAPAEPSETEAATEAEPTETEAEPTESEPVETEAVVTEAPEETEQAQEEETTPAETAESTEEVLPEVTEETEETVASEETTETAAPETTAETTEEEIVAPTPTEGPSLDIEDEEPQEEEPEIQSVSWDGETFSNVYEDDLVRVTFKLINVWTTGYNASVKIENLSDKAIENWGLSFDFGGEIATIWNAKITSQAAGQLTVKNAGWNQDIPAGGSVEFGMQGSEEFCGFPETYKILGSICAVSEENFSVDYVLDSDWDEGFSAALILTNTSEEALEDWTLEFDYARNITELWNGALISHEGDHYVIKNADYNANINPGESVRIAFNGTDGLPEDVPTNFKLTIIGDKSEELDLDTVVVTSAYSDVHVGYTNGDSQYNVKHNLVLDTEVDGATVTWTSSDAGVVDAAGNVYRLYDESVLINLTATISSGEFSMEKSFEIRVIKSMYDDFSTDEIYVLEQDVQLYYYNPVIADLKIYKNDYGYIKRVQGSVSDVLVDSPDEAMLAIYGVHELLGMEDAYGELVLGRISKTADIYTYSFSQVKNGVPVIGSYVSIDADQYGNVLGLMSSYIPVTEDTNASVSVDSAISNISGLAECIESDLSIWVDGNNSKLVWRIEYLDSDNNLCYAYVDAHNGAVLVQNEVSQALGQTADGEPIEHKGFDKYCVIKSQQSDGSTIYYLQDPIRRIGVARYNKTYSPEGSDPHVLLDPEYEYDEMPFNGVSCTTEDGWNDADLNPYIYARRLYYHFAEFGLDGFGENNFLYILTYRDFENAEHADARSGGDHFLSFGMCAGGHWGNYPRIVGHEYSHGIVTSNSSLNGFDCTKEATAINEAYADMFSYLWVGAQTWDMSFPNGKNYRNSADPVYRHYDHDKMLYEWEEHDSSTMLSYVGYKLRQSGLSDDQMTWLLLKSLPSLANNSTYKDVRDAWLSAASTLGYGSYYIQRIEDLFAEIGISADIPEEFDFTYHAIGKVREAKLSGSSLVFSDLASVNVELSRDGDPSFNVLSVLTGTDGMYDFDKIVPGKYTLKFTKSGYLTATLSLSVLNMENIYVDTVDMIKQITSGSTKGTVTGKVIDAVTGEAIPGMTIRVRTGWGNTNNANRPIATVTTDSNGSYSLTNYEYGYYTLQVSDNRTGVTDKYKTNFKNIVVLGNGQTITNQDIPVSNQLTSNQIRIVLEWGAQPRDLDSHLIGYRGTQKLFEVYYSNKIYGYSTRLVALDRDDVDGYGPETTTIYQVTEDDYLFYVYNFSGTGNMAMSDATVKVYFGLQTVPTYVFNVPSDATSGRYWNVFVYHPDDGKRVRPINTVTSSPSRGGY